MHFIGKRKESPDTTNMPDTTSTTAITAKNIEDYYPIRANTKYIYEISGENLFYNELTIDYITDYKVQQRIKQDDNVTINVIEVRDGKVIKTLSQKETFFRENLLDSAGQSEILLMEPLVTGTKWTLSNSRVRMISNDAAIVSTPFGNYKAIEVVTEGENIKTYDYYAEGVGLVKSVSIEGEKEISCMLSEVDENVYLIEKLSIYYPDFQDMRVYRKISEVPFRTNDSTEKILSDLYKLTLENEAAVLTKNTEINSLYLDDSKTIHVDLNKSFINETKTTSIREGMILQSITNTFAKFFHANKAIITIENEDYNSKHIALYNQPIPVKTRPFTKFYDIVIYGGTPSGIMAAIAAAREGADVALVEPSYHIGGMITGGLCFTDYRDTTIIGGLPKEFFNRVGKYYGNDISWTFEPHVAEEIFIKMVQEAEVDVYFNNFINENEGVIKVDEKIISIKTQTGNIFRGQVFIDSTYKGDLMAMSGVSYTYGREGKNQYDENLAGIRPPTDALNFIYPLEAFDENGKLFEGISLEQPGITGDGDKKIQAYNYRLCLTKNTENQKPFTMPKNYDPDKYKLLAAWLKNLKIFEGNRSLNLYDVLFLGILPNDKYDMNNSGPFSSDYTGASWEYPEADYKKRAEIEDQHKEYIQGMLYFLSTDESVPVELREKMKKLGYAADEFVDNDNWPYQIYLREGRRMLGNFVMTQNDLEKDNKKYDSIGMGSYNIDSHNVTRYINAEGHVQNEGIIQVSVDPYEIPYRIMIPQKSEADNLIVSVCVSASHVAYSSIRMEPQYMIMGEAAGIAAAISADKDSSVQDINEFSLILKLRRNGAVLELPFAYLFQNYSSLSQN